MPEMALPDPASKTPKAFRRLTGTTPTAFDNLLAQLTPLHQAADARRRARPGRKRKPPGAGSRPRRLRIAAVSGSYPGRVHDKKIYDEARVVAPPDVKRTGDTAYLGTALETPSRKPRGGELTEREKAGNRRVATRRSTGSAR
jgi:hypothetical protein